MTPPRAHLLALILLALPLALPMARPAAAAPLIANGGFETGDFTAWTQSGNTQFTTVFNQDYDGLSPQAGSYYALLGPAGSDGILSQTFIDAPGAALRLSFWLASDGGAPSDFSASYDGAALMRLVNAGVFGWTEYSATVTGTGNDTLTFSFRDDQNYFALDGIAVNGIPEPSGFLLLPAAILAFFARKKKAGGHVPCPPDPASSR